jgi:AbrB family looped-hinge helix DNA binding protein
MLIPENASRKLDNLGRVTLPKGLRDRLVYRENDEIEFFTMEQDGKIYVCLAKVGQNDSKWAKAAAVLEDLELPVPDKLKEYLD